ncbi:MAG: AAA family ATPase [Variovorax sp.]
MSLKIATKVHICLATWRHFCNSITAAIKKRDTSTIFVAEPWPEVYVRNAERQASFERATRSYAPTVAAYVEAGYSTCVIPKVSLQARVAFVLEQMANMM